MEPEQLASVIESVLFVSSKPLTAKELAKLLETDLQQVEQALNALTEKRKAGGVVILENNGEYQMATQPKNSTAVKNFLNAELREKLTDATVEVLAIIAYRQPISKAEIEAIRGVNSQYSIRHLLMRGLIDKIPNPRDARGFLYQTTTEFLMHLGLTSVKELPEFEKLVEQIKLPETPAVQEAAMMPEAPVVVGEPELQDAITPANTDADSSEIQPKEPTLVELQQAPPLPEIAPAENLPELPTPKPAKEKEDNGEDEFDDEDEDNEDDEDEE